MYELKDVSKTYQKKGQTIQALDKVSLVIKKGEFVTIKGNTGGGKSTLLQVLGGLDIPTLGSVLLDGENLSKKKQTELSSIRGKKIGFIFQSFNLIPTLTALENVEMGLVPLGMKSTTRKTMAQETLQAVGLSDRLNHYPSELSGGQQQRVAIARSLVKNPEVILADEPTGNLDEDMRDEIFEILLNLWKDKGLTLIVVTHDKEIANKAPHRVTLKKGQVVNEEII